MSNDSECEYLKPILYDEEPSEELLEWAKKNINEDPDKKDLWIAELNDLIYEKGECIPRRTDDEFLLRFLRARHFIVRKAHRLMVNYHEFLESNPQYYKNVNVFRIRELAKTSLFSVPPYRDQHGRRMLIIRIGCWNPAEYTITETIQLVSAMLEMSLLEPQAQIKGVTLIIDLSEFSLNLAWYLTPSLANSFLSLAGLAFPIRVQAVHFLFTSWIFDTAWGVMKPLLPEGVSDRIFFHKDNLENFHSQIDPKYLPKRYGGIHEDYSVDMWFENVIMKNQKCIDEFIKLGYEDIKLLLNSAKEEQEKSVKEMKL